jgi:electron transport complex protein RnfA
MDVLTIFISAIFVNNILLAQFLGNCPYLGCSREKSVAIGMGGAVVFVTIMATLFTWIIQHSVLDAFDLGYLQTIVFIVVIASLVQFVEMFLKKAIPSLYSALGIYLPLITTNCAVLGVTINNITDGYNFLTSMVSSLGCGLGFLLAMVLFAGVRSRVEEAIPPKPFSGIPITLISASIVALAFYGFSGIITNIFG